MSEAKRIVYVLTPWWDSYFVDGLYDGVEVGDVLEELELPCVLDYDEAEVLDWSDFSEWRSGMGECFPLVHDQMFLDAIDKVRNGELSCVDLDVDFEGKRICICSCDSVMFTGDFVEAVKARNDGRFLNVPYRISSKPDGGKAYVVQYVQKEAGK